MLTNIGNTSFILYGIFILITVISMLGAFLFIRKGYDSHKLDKMIDLFKYTIVTVAIATVTLIISDLFKERELELKELEYFGKYIERVEKADSIRSRYELTRYLSIVAPNGELKKSWQRYYDTLRIEYQEYLRLKKEKEQLDSVRNPTKEQQIEKERLREKIQQKNAPLVGSQQQDPTFASKLQKEYYIHFADKNGYPIARNLEAKLTPALFPKKVIKFLYDWTDPKAIQLAPGSYIVTVEFKDRTYTQKITITPGMDQPIVFNLDTDDNP